MLVVQAALPAHIYRMVAAAFQAAGIVRGLKGRAYRFLLMGTIRAMSEQIFDPTRLSLDEQVAYLLEGTYFADEGGADAASVGQASVLANNASQAGTLAP